VGHEDVNRGPGSVIREEEKRVSSRQLRADRRGASKEGKGAGGGGGWASERFRVVGRGEAGAESELHKPFYRKQR